MMRLDIDDAPRGQDFENPSLHSVSIALWRPIALTDFIHAADSPIRIHWQHGDMPIAYAGYGAAAVIKSNDSDRFSDTRAQAQAVFSTLTFEIGESHAEPRFFGGFAFQPDVPSAPWEAFNPAWFVMPRVMLTDVAGQQWLTLTDELNTDRSINDLRSEAIMLATCFEAYEARSWQSAPALISTDYPLSQPAWRQQVNAAVDRIHAGVLEKVVLSRTCDLTFDKPIDPLAVLDRLALRYPQTYRFMMSPNAESAFVGATPEVLVEVNAPHIRTAAVAGSIGRGKSPQEDAELAAQLFMNPKERHEHALVADNLRDLLEPLTTDLLSPEEPHILTLGNIQHLHTPFQGTLSGDTDALDVVDRLHPTPALGGCPQKVAMDTILELEPLSRGWYASPVGWFDRHGNGLFAVAIRSAIFNGDTARLYAGCGIVGQSDADREWEETKIKFKPMLEALGASFSL
jgi:menaquinone-specific isochorismate synthase